MRTPLQQAFEKWLEENNAQIVVGAVAPLGDTVRIANFLPPGWGASVLIVPKEPVADNGNRA